MSCHTAVSMYEALLHSCSAPQSPHESLTRHSLPPQAFEAYAVGGIIVLWKWGDGTHVHLSAEGSEARTRVGDGTAHCGGDGWVSSLTLSPDDLYLVSAHDGPSQSYLVTWDVSGLITGDDIVELFRAPVPKLADAALFAATVGHTPQTALSFSADGRLLFSVHFHGSRTPAASW